MSKEPNVAIDTDAAADLAACVSQAITNLQRPGRLAGCRTEFYPRTVSISIEVSGISTPTDGWEAYVDGILTERRDIYTVNKPLRLPNAFIRYLGRGLRVDVSPGVEGVTVAIRPDPAVSLSDVDALVLYDEFAVLSGANADIVLGVDETLSPATQEVIAVSDVPCGARPGAKTFIIRTFEDKTDFGDDVLVVTVDLKSGEQFQKLMVLRELTQRAVEDMRPEREFDRIELRLNEVAGDWMKCYVFDYGSFDTEPGTLPPEERKFFDAVMGVAEDCQDYVVIDGALEGPTTGLIETARGGDVLQRVTLCVTEGGFRWKLHGNSNAPATTAVVPVHKHVPAIRMPGRGT